MLMGQRGDQKPREPESRFWRIFLSNSDPACLQLLQSYSQNQREGLFGREVSWKSLLCTIIN